MLLMHRLQPLLRLLQTSAQLANRFIRLGCRGELRLGCEERRTFNKDDQCQAFLRRFLAQRAHHELHPMLVTIKLHGNDRTERGFMMRKGLLQCRIKFQLQFGANEAGDVIGGATTGWL